MSKIAISPNVSGTGTFTIAAPDSNTNRTLTLPDAGGSVVLNEGSGTFKIDASGNVGIGVTPSAWSSSWKVLEGTGGGSFYFGSTQASVGSNAFNDGASWKYKTTAPAGVYTNVQGAYVWYTAPSGTAGNAITFTQAMTLDASGQLFLPNGNIYGKSDNTGAMSVYGGGAYNSGAGITLTGQSNSTANAIIFTRGNYIESARIDASGSLLVGTTSTFDNVSFLKAQVLGGVATKIDTTLATSQVSFFNSNGRVGFIGTSGTATSYNTSSDYRLKENVVPLIGAASRIAQIPVHQFNFIADPDTTVDGFLAHEVQTVIPEAVHGTKDEVDADGNPVYQGIDQSKLVPLLTAALQEALADIATLKAEVAALKGASA